MTNAIHRVPALETLPIKKFFNGPEAFTPDARVHPRRVGGARVLGRRRASARTASPAPAASARRWPSGSSTASRSGRSGRSTSAASAPPTPRQRYTLARTYEALLEVLRHQVPGRGAEGRPAAARLAGLRAPRRARRRLRREVGLGARELVRVERRRRRRVAAAARLGGRELVAGDRRRGRRDPHGGRACSTSRASPRSRSSAPARSALLQRLCANDVSRPVGTRRRTRRCSTTRGGIECDLSVIRTAEDRFLLITGTAFGTHDRRWIERHAPPRRLRPRHRRDREPRLLRPLGAARPRHPAGRSPRPSLAHADFPYMSAREIAVGDVPCLAVRVTYVGELGWELYCPAEYGARACGTTLYDAGQVHGLVPCGYRAIDALRLEKGYRAWATDITPDTTPDEAGLGFAVKPDKGRLHRPRRGRRQRAAGGPAARPRVPGAGRAARDRAGLRARAAHRRRGAGPRHDAAATASPWPRRSPGPGCPPRRAEPGTRARGRHLRRLGRRRGRAPSRCTTRRASASAAEPYAVARTSTTKLVRSPRKKPTAYSSGRSSWS